MHDATRGPDVAGNAGRLVSETLGCHVVNCPFLIVGPDLTGGCHHHFTNSEVTQLQFAELVHKDILWFQVGVQDVLFVQALESLHDLEHVPENVVLWHEESLFFVVPNLTSQVSVYKHALVEQLKQTYRDSTQ